MASAVIHMCVAKKVNQYLKMDERIIILGSIAPDISKLVKETKFRSHFLKEDKEDSEIDIKAFLNLYKEELDKPFEMGYFIHLLTDRYWFRDYVYKYINGYLKDKQLPFKTYTEIKDSIYSDYSRINVPLIDYYNLDLDLFFNGFSYPQSKIKEIPMEKLEIFVDSMGILIKNSVYKKPEIMSLDQIIKFIEECSLKIIEIINKYNLIKTKVMA